MLTGDPRTNQARSHFLGDASRGFDDYINNGTRRNLESTAVRRYRELQDVDLVPVDLPTPEADFFADNEGLYERVAGVHSEVRRSVGRSRRNGVRQGAVGHD